MNNTIVSLLFLLMLAAPCTAQTFDEYRNTMHSRFNSYRQDRQQRLESYRDSLNSRYASFMRKAWARHDIEPAMPVPVMPKPVDPVIARPDIRPDLPIDKEIRPIDIVVTPAKKPEPEAKPLVVPEQEQEPLQKPEQEPLQRPQPPAAFKFNYYGTVCSLPFGNRHSFSLSGINENAVADAWLILSDKKYTPVINSCLEWKNRLDMCDWGYVMFVEKACDTFFKGKVNESCLMQMYILAQSGYKVRIARTGSKLALLIPSEAEIWQYPYLSINGYKYYIYSKDPGSECHLFEQELPREVPISLHIREEQAFAYSPTAERRLSSSKYKEATVAIRENLNLIKFMESYPLSNTMPVYAECTLSEHAKQQLYPPLRKAIEGKGEGEAAGILLDFVQTAFEYQTDDEQFGHEKPQFADETLYYRYCDCEDRSILFYRLVRDLLGLDAVLLRYPGHLATAVRFNDSSVSGDYYAIDGQKYFVCDPTYINAGIATIMPGYRNTTVEIIRIKQSL